MATMQRLLSWNNRTYIYFLTFKDKFIIFIKWEIETETTCKNNELSYNNEF